MLSTRLKAKVDKRKEQSMPAKKRGSAARKNVAKIAKKVSAKNNGHKPLGFQVWWDLSGVDGLHKHLEDHMTNMGCADCIPELPDFNSRMFIATKAFGAKHGAAVKRAGRNAGHTVYRPVQLAKSTDKKAKQDEHKPSLDPTVYGPISVNDDDGSVSLGDPNCPIGQAAVAEYMRLETNYTSKRLREAILLVVEKHNGVSMRKQGGMYFVPYTPEAEETLNKLQEFVHLHLNCDLYIPDLPATDEWKRSAQTSTMRSLDGKYAETFEAVESFIASMQSGDLVGTRSLKAKLNVAKELKSKAGIYKEILEDRGEKLEKASEVISDVMSQVMDATIEVRALKKASGSERAAELAEKLIKEIATKTKKQLEKARKAHAPVTVSTED